MKKRITSILIAMWLCIACTMPSIALETDNSTNIISKAQGNTGVVFNLVTENTMGNGIGLYSTWTGPGGTCSLQYNQRGYLYWSITPDSYLPYVFIGIINIYSADGKYIDGKSIWCQGFRFDDHNESISGMGLKNNKMYKAVISGSATDSSGRKFTIVPNASISFKY